MNKHYDSSQSLNVYSDGSRLFRQHTRQIAHDAAQWCQAVSRFASMLVSRPSQAPTLIWNVIISHFFNLSTGLILVWILLLSWGEASSFSGNIAACDWKRWEQWPQGATPHHLVFVADPQLVDPHTYPDRPWPLNILTIHHTDRYLRRAYSRIQTRLDPNTILFLGDLFDGGREWSTQNSQSPEARYHAYGDAFWIREFDRFHNIFLREWDSARTGTNRDRRIIASLPGNHDLGFGHLIQRPVRDRFNAYFGDGNRVDVIGNHTFVSLDTVSLSAMVEENSEGMTDIWRPAEEFLISIDAKKAEAIELYLNISQYGISATAKFSHSLETILHPNVTQPESPEDITKTSSEIHRRSITQAPHLLHSDLPTILLTHVPLYRPPGTPCGPMRERHPPSTPLPGDISPVFPDEPNAISVSGGYQYQNVLTEPLTQHILSALGGTVSRVFSGDDHDYCEVLHTGYAKPAGKDGIKEITVKSLSWAMGVRKPGFLLASMWNELDSKTGRRKVVGHGGSGSLQDTMQTHLCLLPDELGILARYAVLLVASMILLLMRAIVYETTRTTPRTADLNSKDDALPLLPTFASSKGLSNTQTARTRTRSVSSAEREKCFARNNQYYVPPRHFSPYDAQPSPSAASSSNSALNGTTLSTRGGYGYQLPTSTAAVARSRASSVAIDSGELGSTYAPNINVDDDYDSTDFGWRRKRSWKTWPRRVAREWTASVCRVGGVAVAWYIVLWIWA